MSNQILVPLTKVGSKILVNRSFFDLTKFLLKQPKFGWDNNKFLSKMSNQILVPLKKILLDQQNFC